MHPTAQPTRTRLFYCERYKLLLKETETDVEREENFRSYGSGTEECCITTDYHFFFIIQRIVYKEKKLSYKTSVSYFNPFY